MKIISLFGLILLILSCGNVYQNKIDKSDKCTFKNRKFVLPKIRKFIGDTISIKNTKSWLLNSEKSEEEQQIENVINRGSKFFLINETGGFITIGTFGNEEGHHSIYAFLINKENCEILGMELLAEKSDWEHGYQETFSVFENEFSIKRIKQTGAKDWGDYTKWEKNTIVSIITFTENGFFVKS